MRDEDRDRAGALTMDTRRPDPAHRSSARLRRRHAGGGSTYAEGESDIVVAVAGTGLFGLLIGVCGWTVAEWKTLTLGTLRGQVLGLDGASVPASQET